MRSSCKMSHDDSAWVKETSNVLGGGDAIEEQTSPFQITMPYVVLQIMQRLEPNHSVQVNATGSADKRLNISCTRSSTGDEVVFSFNGVDMDSDVMSGMTISEAIAGPVFSSSLDVTASLCDTDVLTSMSSVTNDVIFNDSGDSQPCRMYPSSDFTNVDVMKSCSEIEIVHGSDSAAMLDADGRLASGVGAAIEPLFSTDHRDILGSTGDSELIEPNTVAHSPRISHSVTAYRCALCTGLSYSLDRAIQHAKRQHSMENASAGAVDIVPELLPTVYYCRICDAPSRTSYHWQSHMRRRHRVVVDRRRKPGADPRIRERKRLASLKDKSFTPIECVACGRQMRLTESYYLHIRRSHRDDGMYAVALAHLDEVRRARRERLSSRTIAVTPCPFCGVRMSSVRHLILVHCKEPTVDAAVAATRNKLRMENIRQRKARAAAKVECANCGRRMSHVHMRTHVQYHCSQVFPELNMESSVLLESADATASNILALEPSAVADDCTAVSLPEDDLPPVENAVECEMVSVSDIASEQLYSEQYQNHSVARMITCTENSEDLEKICGKRLNVKAYNSHRRKFHGKGSEKSGQSCCCPYCDRKFWDRYHLQRHMTVHTNEKVVVCLLCQHTFMHQFSYSEHFQKTHLRHFIHSCDSCGRRFWKRTDKVKHKCKPENHSTNVWNNEQLQLKAEQLLANWKGPLFTEMNRTEANSFPRPLKRQHVTKAWQTILCILCNKSFSSMRCYQLHHKHAHLLQFDHKCSTCDLCFVSRQGLQNHNCMPHRHRVNAKKREVLASRMQKKMQSMPEPYFVFIDADNPVIPYTAANTDDSIQSGSAERSFPTSIDDIDTNEGVSNNSDDKPASGSSLSQNDPFQLTESAEAVLSCLPHCEQELLQSASMEPLQTELEMDVCDALELESTGGGEDEQLDSHLCDVNTSILATEPVRSDSGMMPEDTNKPGTSTSVQVFSQLEKTSDDGITGSVKSQHWLNATSLGDGRLLCNICHKELRVTNYYPHMRRVHKMASSQSRPISWKVCDRCGYQCQDNYKLRRHSLIHMQFAAGAVLCELCDRLFYEHMDYKHHFKRCHLGQFSIRCEACYKGFWKTNSLRQHTCYPEMRDENVRLQHEKEEEALRQRREVRQSMGLGEGAGVDLVNVSNTQKTDCDAVLLQDCASASESFKKPSGHDIDKVPPTQSQSSCKNSNASVSTDVFKRNIKLLPKPENKQSNTVTSSKPEVSALPCHGYSTRKKRISFRELLQYN